MRKIGNGVWSLNVEPLNFELPWALSHATCQLLYTVPGIAVQLSTKDLTPKLVTPSGHDAGSGH
jgi:hypothetical protein